MCLPGVKKRSHYQLITIFIIICIASCHSTFKILGGHNAKNQEFLVMTNTMILYVPLWLSAILGWSTVSQIQLTVHSNGLITRYYKLAYSAQYKPPMWSTGSKYHFRFMLVATSATVRQVCLLNKNIQCEPITLTRYRVGHLATKPITCNLRQSMRGCHTPQTGKVRRVLTVQQNINRSFGDSGVLPRTWVGWLRSHLYGVGQVKLVQDGHFLVPKTTPKGGIESAISWWLPAGIFKYWLLISRRR